MAVEQRVVCMARWCRVRGGSETTKSMIAPIENDMINGIVRGMSDGSASCEKML
jgi:hypothetical protein